MKETQQQHASQPVKPDLVLSTSRPQQSEFTQTTGHRHPVAVSSANSALAGMPRMMDVGSNSARIALLSAQRKAVSAVTTDELTFARSTDGLPASLKTGIETLSGMSMDHVKVHTNSSEPARINAHAYTQGSDIYLAPGQEKYLAHEAWHVVQQAQGRVMPTMQMKGGSLINDDKALESEADAMGDKATSVAKNMATTTATSQHAAVDKAHFAKNGGNTTDKVSQLRTFTAPVIQRFFSECDEKDHKSETCVDVKTGETFYYRWIEDGQWDEARYELSKRNTGWRIRNLYIPVVEEPVPDPEVEAVAGPVAKEAAVEYKARPEVATVSSSAGSKKKLKSNQKRRDKKKATSQVSTDGGASAGSSVLFAPYVHTTSHEMGEENMGWDDEKYGDSVFSDNDVNDDLHPTDEYTDFSTDSKEPVATVMTTNVTDIDDEKSELGHDHAAVENIGAGAAPGGETKRSRRRKTLSERQKLAATLVARMREVNAALRNAQTTPMQADQQIAIDALLNRANRGMDDARNLITSIHQGTTVGIMNFEPSVTTALNDYGTWYRNTWLALIALRRRAYTTFNPENRGGYTVSQLINRRPDIFRWLVMHGKLTREGIGYWKSKGESVQFNETKDWSLHLHMDPTTHKWVGHYKHKDVEGAVGYQKQNHVDEATMALLGVEQNPR